MAKANVAAIRSRTKPSYATLLYLSESNEASIRASPCQPAPVCVTVPAGVFTPSMSLFDLCQWLHDSPAAAIMRNSSATFTVINSIHALGIVLVAGTILLVDLRLLGLGLRKEPVTDVVSRIVPLTLSGFAMMALTGLLMFFPEAVRYYKSPAFRIKLVLLALLGLNALIFHLTVYRDAPKWEFGRVPVRARIAGLLSLMLWIGVIAAGRSIPYGKDYDLGFNGAPASAPIVVARCLSCR